MMHLPGEIHAPDYEVAEEENDKIIAAEDDKITIKLEMNTN